MVQEIKNRTAGGDRKVDQLTWLRSDRTDRPIMKFRVIIGTKSAIHHRTEGQA